jgi:four helix bundle protein
MSYQSFEDLQVWQKACRLCVEIYRIFENCKTYAIRDQVQRAALSIPSNIAEGHERNSKKEFLRFLHIAQGSCGELRTQIYIARKLDLLTKEQFEQTKDEIKSIAAMLQGLKRSLQPPKTEH